MAKSFLDAAPSRQKGKRVWKPHVRAAEGERLGRLNLELIKKDADLQEHLRELENAHKQLEFQRAEQQQALRSDSPLDGPAMGASKKNSAEPEVPLLEPVHRLRLVPTHMLLQSLPEWNLSV